MSTRKQRFVKGGRSSRSASKGGSPDTAVPVRLPQAHTLAVEPVADDAQYAALPKKLVESLRYLINSRELSGEAPLQERIAVTSSVRGEGSTTVSQALAALLADDFGSWVCWVDLSWARSGAPPRATGQAGIFDVLDGRAKISEVVRFAPQLGVAVVSAGTVPRDGRNVVARSSELEEMLAFLSKEFQHVVFDMPPVLGSTAGLPLFRFADEYLLVCKSGVTRNDQLERATDQLTALPLIGTVINEQTVKTPSFLQRMLIGNVRAST